MVPSPSEVLASDTPMTTSAGHSFIAPAAWSVETDGVATILTAPEGGSRVALVDVEASDAERAVDSAWSLLGRETKPLLEAVERDGDTGGWTDIHRFKYVDSPNSGRWTYADARRADAGWHVMLFDMSAAVAEKRYAQWIMVYERRYAKGHAPESFAGKRAHRLDAARVAALVEFVESARVQTKVPGISVGIVQDGEIVFVGGFGVRALGEPATVDADTKFMIASNTKALTTLMLAKLVDEGRVAWDTPATELWSSFALGDASTTAKVQVKHLVCACTGLPRQDFEWTFEYANASAEDSMRVLATMQPTSEFGELYQYSNPLAGAAGYLGGHVAFPKLGFADAYEEAMRALVFEPLQMHSTTLDSAEAQQGNWARAHAPDLDGTMAPAVHALNLSKAWSPAGAAWSTARDMLRYVQLELAEGTLADGARYIGAEALLARRIPQVSTGSEATYGMGLEVMREHGVTLIHHGGDLVGYHSDMMWLPEHGVGAVILTNGAPGAVIVEAFRRKLLEVLFDGRSEADDAVVAGARSAYARLAGLRRIVQRPPSSDVVGQLAPVYMNDVLGELAVRDDAGALVFDFGEWQTEMASRRNPDGTRSLIGVSPGIDFVDFVMGRADGRATLRLVDYQHSYVFVEQGATAHRASRLAR
ncbi:MAG: serine hydrolase domain-containing protein [Nannocystaceae bacterium]|nr:beta-lactamase family protein [bacterium]